MRAFQAYAKGDYRTTQPTPRAAAEVFFDKFPSKRKCNIIEGESDGDFFTVKLGQPWPRSWVNVTKKTAAALPDYNEVQ